MSSNKSFGGLGGLINKFAGGSTAHANANANTNSAVSTGNAPINQGAAPVNQTTAQYGPTVAQTTTPAATSTGQQDYGDKGGKLVWSSEIYSAVNDPLAAFALIAKKSGHNIDAKTSEKITDGARNIFEKLTGYVLIVYLARRQNILLVS